MKFLDDNLLLESELAQELYSAARELPIVDYHSHLSPREIAEDKRFFNLTQLWLSGDHYKWRLMRNCGVPERLITGDAPDREKFMAFSSVLPLCIGNPIYIWCHLELKTYFGITRPLNADTAAEIYAQTQRMMKERPYTAQNFIRNSRVELLCTTDDPLDDLAFHRALAENPALGFQVRPTYRPDKILHIELSAFVSYAQSLTDKNAPSLSEIKEALTARLDDFRSSGCFVTDHALDRFIYKEKSEGEISEILAAALAGKSLSEEDAEAWQTHILLYLAEEYAKRDMAMQLHFDCLRNNNRAMYEALGPDTGFDSANASHAPLKLVRFLDALAARDSLPKIIVYSLDPNADKLLNTVIHCYQGKSRGRLQHGSAWWFNDTKGGMRAHLAALSEYGVLGNFIGMLTDSRSFTSYVRHDYFRRILCNHLAECVRAGEYPEDKRALLALVSGICHDNAKEYFGI